LIVPGLLALASLTLAAGTAPSSAASPPSTPAQTTVSTPADEDRSPAAAKLAEAFRRAHEARDARAFEKLVDWKNVTASTRKAVLGSFERNLGQRIQAIHVTPSDPKEVFEYTLESVTYRPNLAPFRVLTIWFEMTGGGIQRASYLVGRARDGSYRIATAAPVP
jgi:hypothetical protein